MIKYEADDQFKHVGEMYSTTLLCVCLSAWAVVEVNMEDRVEVSRGETAQIACMFTTEEGIGAIDIMWFYVSFMMRTYTDIIMMFL